MRISDSKIEELRERVDIVDVIGKVVPLRKNGRNYKGVCPFHQEKTPSFIVSPDKKIFHCFGCHKGGDAIRFVQLYNKVSYVEAVQELAEEYRVAIEFNNDKVDKLRQEEEPYYELNTMVAKYFSENLTMATVGATAREYLKKREIKIQTIRTFGLGFALPERTALYEFLKSKNADIDKAVELGLILKNERGYFDRFAGRIIFPLFSQNGRVIGFAGRIMGNQENVAKYVNSPESKIYTKGRTLYGLFKSKDAIRQNDLAIVVEGYMDYLALYQNGVENVVAVSGTAFTDDQAKLLSRYSKTVLLLFDADTAGFKASLRSIEILLKQQINIRISALAQGEDPDSYIRKNGKEAFEQVIETAQNFLEYQAEYYKTEGKLDDPASAGSIVAELMGQLALFDDSIKQAFYIQTLARKTGLREHLLEQALEKAKAELKKRGTRYIPPADKPVPAADAGSVPEAGTTAECTALNNAVVKREQAVIKTLLTTTQDAVYYLLDELHEDMFRHKIFKKIFNMCHAFVHANGEFNINELIDGLEDEAERRIVFDMITERYDITYEKWNELMPQRVNAQMPIREATEVYLELLNAQNDEEIEIVHRRQKMTEVEEEKKVLMEDYTRLHKRRRELKTQMNKIRRIR